MTPIERRNLRIGLLFVFPWLIGLGVFILYPVLSSLWHGFTDYSVLKPPVFVGLDNFKELAVDAVFRIALGNTLFYAFFYITLGTCMAIATALLLNTGIKGMSLYRTCFFLPSLMPVIASAVLWKWIFNGSSGGSYGILNHLLSLIGITGPAWLNDIYWAKPALIIMALWGMGHTMIIYLAGLQNIPKALYEAAEIDGAGFWRRLWHITLPTLSPVIYFNMIMAIIQSLQVFAGPYIITDGTGGPARSTTFYAMYLFEVAFEDLRMGYAGAMAWVMFLLILALTLLVSRTMIKRVHYGEGS